MSKVIGCIIARMHSTRLPKKSLKEIKGKTMVECIIDRTKKAKHLDDIYLCTSIDPTDEVLLNIAKKNVIKAHAGSRVSVIDRLLEVAEMEHATDLVRITGDNPFTDEMYMDEMIRHHIENKMEYTRVEQLPMGVTAEVISVEALKRCRQNSNPAKSEYLTVYIFDPQKYKCMVLIPPKQHQKPFWSLTVDTPDDFERTLFIADRLGAVEDIGLDAIIDLGQKTSIPHLKLDSGLEVKLPDGDCMTLGEFRNLLDKITQESTIVQLPHNFYEKNQTA